MAKRRKQTKANETGSAELTEEQRACIRFLVKGNRMEEAAGTVGVDPSVVSAWLQEPSFLAAYNALNKHCCHQPPRGLYKHCCCEVP